LEGVDSWGIVIPIGITIPQESTPSK
jgi:hypothetical protein